MDRAVSLGSNRLDSEQGLLTRAGRPVAVRAKTFALLVYLARNRGRVLSKDEILAAVWPGLAVSDDTLTQTIRDARRALGVADAELIQTVPRRGYMLQADGGTAPAEDGPPLIAVLPFLCQSEQPTDVALADGIAEEIIHGLGRYSQVRVVPLHAAFRFRPETAPAIEAARQLSAHYFVEGALRHTAEGHHLSVTLCDCATGQRTWGDRFMLSASGLRDVSATVPHRIVTHLTHDIEQRIALRPLGSGTGDLGAYRHFVAGLGLIRQYDPGVNEQAATHFRAALERDPRFALAHSYLALAEVIIAGHGGAPEAVLHQALRRCELALTLAPDEARSHWMLSMIRLYLGQHSAAELHIRRAVELNPCDPDNLAYLGLVLAHRGRADEGVAIVAEAIRLNPGHPAWYFADMAMALRLAGRYREALVYAELVPAGSCWRELRIARCHAMLGHKADAARYMRKALALAPDGWDPARELGEERVLEITEERERQQKEILLAFAALRHEATGS